MEPEIQRHPDVPDNIIALKPRDSFEAHAEAMGDALAERYESGDVLVLPVFPIRCDLDFLNRVSLPAAYKKVGAVDGLDAPLLRSSGGKVGLRADHPLSPFAKDDPLRALYLRDQVASIFDQVRRGLHLLFPRYRSMREGNITFRFTHTEAEIMHYDAFRADTPFHRVKLFVNLDSQPRRWRVSYRIEEFVARYRHLLPDPLPAGGTELNRFINDLPETQAIPAHELAYPTLTAVLANGEAVAHQVTFGRRMVAAEFLVPVEEMVLPDLALPACYARLAGTKSDTAVAAA